MPSEGMGGTEEDFTSWKHGSCQGQLVAVKDVLKMGGEDCVEAGMEGRVVLLLLECPVH